jgi:ribosomal protein S18 acetylase RimI-like enzyme
MSKSRESELRVRPARPEDREFLLALIPRLVEFGPPTWHDPARMNETDALVLDDSLSGRTPGASVFVAEDGEGARLGFIHLRPVNAYYNPEEHGHVADLIVARGAEGRGVGRALLEKGEEWARGRGYGWLTLSVFAQNVRARELYERAGFGADMMGYVKKLD